ncbi:unnamed protein product [Ilex paraguariensis]|uniref:Protein kinase domain-containing protein n=1 Tax=Ilex paraguariensis TaxID=185542 RepID=A0ABC8QRC6_9AQUA
MAFDPNSMPKNLCPLNIAGTMPEDSLIAPVTTSGRTIEGFYANQPQDIGSIRPVPSVYHPATISDTGFVSLGYGNGAPGGASWVPRVLPPGVVGGVYSTTEYDSDSNFMTRACVNASDQPRYEGGDDSVSGKKVKFLCSFGGKILPRPSDGALRYVGGQTRIISVKRDVRFSELVQKMVDICGQNMVIKYQLPDEDLDALVSVSCSDDLENMMDEYEKLFERSSDGSAKLRLFLFSASELDSGGVLQFKNLHDSGQRYVEAVNGVMDVLPSSITRKESMASATSTQNTDLSGTEVLDSLSHGQGDVTGPPSTGVLSPRGNFTTSQEIASIVVTGDPNAAIYAVASAAPLGIPAAKSVPLPALPTQLEHELERSFLVTAQQQQQQNHLQQPGVRFPQPTPYLQAYIDPRPETLNHSDYVQLPSQMGFPTQLMGPVGPVFTQQHIATGVSPQQFIPAVHMTMGPSSHGSMRPNAIPPLVQPQQVQLERYPEESTLGQRVVQLPADQSYNAYQAQISPAILGGGHGWCQVPKAEQMSIPEGWVPHQPAMVPETIPIFENCHMCQKALPHAHSDTVAQDQRGSPASTISDSNSSYHSLRLDDKGRPVNKAVVSGAFGVGFVEQQGAGAQPRVVGHIDHEAGKRQAEGVGISQNVEGQYENDRCILQKANNPDHANILVPQLELGLTGDMQSPYGVYTPILPQSCQENAVQQFVVPTQNQVKQDVLMNRPGNDDIPPVGGMPFQTSDLVVHESPKDNSGKLLGIVPKEDIVDAGITYDHFRQIDGGMGNLWIGPPEALVVNERSKSPMDNPKKDGILESRPQQITGREAYLDSTFSKTNMALDPNFIKPNDMLPSSNETTCFHNFRPVESCEVCQPPRLGHLTERIQPIGEWKDNPSQFQPKIVPSNVESVLSDGYTPSSISPSNRVGDLQDSSNSLFSNQDPWMLQHDTHFPPPRPNKLTIRKEGLGNRDPLGDDRFSNSGESPSGNGGGLTTEDEVYLPSGHLEMITGAELYRSNKGSAEEVIKQELQAVAEGVAASVLQPSMPSNPDLTILGMNESPKSNRNSELHHSDGEKQHTDEFEDIKTKLPEKANLGFPVSDGIGRLQIIKNSDLEELQELGSGTFGTVYHGKWRGSDVAIKRINNRCFVGKPSEEERMRDDFWNEAIKLADLHHPNVVAFYGVVLDSPGGSVATVTEYMVNGSLRNALQKNERNLDRRKRLLIAMDVAFGMEYLHGKNIVHFDLKSDNLLVNLRDPHRPICKVGDLGLSKVKCQTLISGGVRGTLPWMAPELLNGSSSLVSEKVDVFSFGIVMWELITGEEPYADLHYGAIIGGIVSNTLRPPVPESCDPEWRSLMEKCWSSEPSYRPSFTEIANQLRSMAVKGSPKGQTQHQLNGAPS